MIKKFVTAAVVAVVSLSFVAVAQAEDFAAAPMNPGPMKVTGMGPVGEIANVALIPTNVLLQPFAGTAEAAPMAAPTIRHHHHHRHMAKM